MMKLALGFSVLLPVLYLFSPQQSQQEANSAIRKLQAERISVLQERVAAAQEMSKIGLCDIVRLLEYETEVLLLRAQYIDDVKEREELFKTAIAKMEELVEILDSGARRPARPPQPGTRAPITGLDHLELFFDAKSKLIEIKILALQNGVSE